MTWSFKNLYMQIWVYASLLGWENLRGGIFNFQYRLAFGVADRLVARISRLGAASLRPGSERRGVVKGHLLFFRDLTPHGWRNLSSPPA